MGLPEMITLGERSYQLPWIIVLITASVLILGLITLFRSPSGVRYVLLGLGCLAGLMLLLFVGYAKVGSPVQRQPTVLSAFSEDHLEALTIEQEAAKEEDGGEEASEETKPPITIKKNKPDAPVDVTKPLRVVDLKYEGGGKETVELKSLPSWIKSATIDVPNRYKHVFSSQRFATPLEAEQSLWPMVQAKVRERLHEDYPSFALWEFTPRQLEEIVIQRRCDVAYPLDFGGFTEKVYQLHWEVDIDAASKEKLYALWQPIEANRRLQYLGFAAGAITLLLGAGAFLTRRKAA